MAWGGAGGGGTRPPGMQPPPPPGASPECHSQDGGPQAEGLQGEETAEERTSETSDGHCARLVVSVHSLKLREGGGVSVTGRPALPVPALRGCSPAGFPAHRLAAQLFLHEGLVQLIVAVHWGRQRAA